VGVLVVVAVQAWEGSYRLVGSWPGVEPANRFLAHLGTRGFSVATVRAYAFDLVCLARFLDEQRIALVEVVATDVFAWVDWQVRPRTAGRAAAASSVNRRAAAARAFFEYLVLSGVREDNPVPSARRGQGLRPKARGVLGHLGPGRVRGGGRLVRQQRLLPESLAADDVADFLADLGSRRDRAIVLAMLLGGLRAGEVRRLRLPDVDQGRRQLRLVGKGGRERIVPVDDAFFTELAPTCAASVHRDCPRRSVSWCCTARPPVSR
jgi:site-specific recombinase XerD